MFIIKKIIINLKIVLNIYILKKKKFRYSFSKFNEKNNTSYYSWYDISCKARGNIKF